MPYVFEHHPETNKLSLKPGVPEPWIRPPNPRIKDTTSTWLYCGDCYERCFAQSKRRQSQVPFRDRASQCLMKGPQWTQNRAEASRAKAQAREQGGSNLAEPEEETAERGSVQLTANLAFPRPVSLATPWAMRSSMVTPTLVASSWILSADVKPALFTNMANC